MCRSWLATCSLVYIFPASCCAANKHNISVSAEAAQLVMVLEPLVFLQSMKHDADTYLQLGLPECLSTMCDVCYLVRKEKTTPFGVNLMRSQCYLVTETQKHASACT